MSPRWPGAGARLRHLHRLRAAAFRARRSAEALIARRAGRDRPPFPGGGGALRPRRLDAAGSYRPGLRSRPRRAACSAFAAAPISPRSCRARRRRGHCPSPTIPPMSRRHSREGQRHDARTLTGGGARLARRCGADAGAAARPSSSLWRLDCGEFVIKQYGAFFSDTFQYPPGPKNIVGSCYLIRHGDHYMLWDTGLTDALIGHDFDNAAQTIRVKRSLVDQLAELKRQARADRDDRDQPLAFRPYRPGRATSRRRGC